MIKAHSLLYAIYVCLIVSLLCGALLYMSNLYTQLNVYYSSHEELFIKNQSLVNFALDNIAIPQDIPEDESGIESFYSVKPYGLYSVLKAQSVVHNDTVASAHIIGQYAAEKICIYLPSFNYPLKYSGKVVLKGKKYLPSTLIDVMYIDKEVNLLEASGDIVDSESSLPQINDFYAALNKGVSLTPLNSVEKINDSVYYNSFLHETVTIAVNKKLSNLVIKGNFILKSTDSVFISRNTVLEDVIIIAPKIAFEDNFKGTVQAFATKSLYLGKNVNLNYPSAVCVKNVDDGESKIDIGEGSRIEGSVILYGNYFENINKNNIELHGNCLVIGDIYCSGFLVLSGKVYGSIFTNAIGFKTQTTSYGNSISNVEVDITKRPDYFISPVLFQETKRYGILKKVL